MKRENNHKTVSKVTIQSKVEERKGEGACVKKNCLICWFLLEKRPGKPDRSGKLVRFLLLQ